jgi:CheY-like chemotaxis protein
MPDIKQIVLVGHCAADAYMLEFAIDRAAPGTPVQSVGDMQTLDKLDLSACLLLINRVLSFSYPVTTGVELIAQLRSRPTPPAMMLISDSPDAQQSAEAAGACPGFGKSELMSEKAADRLRAALGRRQSLHPT